jgi:hypothetical protein
MAQRIAGVAFLKVNGDMYPLRGNLTVSPSPMERAMIAGQDYVHGYSELPRVPYIEGDFSTLQGLSIEAIAAMVDVTVTAELANDTTFVLREACCRAALDINAREGQYRVRFEGVQCDEILP